jgi:hypothetical protein
MTSSGWEGKGLELRPANQGRTTRAVLNFWLKTISVIGQVGQ